GESLSTTDSLPGDMERIQFFCHHFGSFFVILIILFLPCICLGKRSRAAAILNRSISGTSLVLGTSI
ncbi:MAG TPA: hypothetical protein PLY23_03580, partial [Alphaproteobacteria bacterium]|nr:hypothetical protein [Alphaproteobacteria bacterium]